MASDGSDIQALRVATAKLLKQAEDTPTHLISVESPNLRVLKNEIRANGGVIKDYVSYLLVSIKKSEAYIRHSLLSLMDYFFTRSHAFREEIIDHHLRDLLMLVCESNPLKSQIPGPVDEARELKIYAIKTIKNWYEKFAVGYVKLQGVSDFLKTSKTVDFERATAELRFEQVKRDEEARKKAAKAEAIANSTRERYEAMKVDMDRCLAEVENGLRILVPVFGMEEEEDPFKPSTSKNDGSDPKFDKRLHGLSEKCNIKVRVESLAPIVKLTEENEAVVETIRDARIMLNVYKNNIVKMLKKLTECGAPQDIVKVLIQQRTLLDAKMEKIDELKLTEKRRRKKKNEDSSDSEDSDWEDVPEKELEIFKPPDEIPSYLMNKVRQLEDADKPGCSKDMNGGGAGGAGSSHAHVASTSASQQSTSSPSKPSIPVIPFGLDLKYWEEGKRYIDKAPKVSVDCHNFWRPPSPDEYHNVASTSSDGGGAVYESRVMTFVGEERRSDKWCKARLPSGKLCPRRDFNKCPIHGVIIERDDEGFPVKEQPIAVEDEMQKKEMQREEEEYIRDVEQATGMSLSMNKKTKSKNKPKERDIGEGSTVRERLEKKLLDKRTMKRVSETLEAVRQAKIQRKFGGQFSHAFL